jgi:hypothetical protein
MRVDERGVRWGECVKSRVKYEVSRQGVGPASDLVGADPRKSCVTERLFRFNPCPLPTTYACARSEHKDHIYRFEEVYHCSSPSRVIMIQNIVCFSYLW